MQRDLIEMIKRGLRAGWGMARSLLTAGLRLQREAMLLCPVDTGALRASAFTRLEGQGPGVGAGAGGSVGQPVSAAEAETSAAMSQSSPEQGPEGP